MRNIFQSPDDDETKPVRVPCTKGLVSYRVGLDENRVPVIHKVASNDQPQSACMGLEVGDGQVYLIVVVDNEVHRLECTPR